MDNNSIQCIIMKEYKAEEGMTFYTEDENGWRDFFTAICGGDDLERPLECTIEEMEEWKRKRGAASKTVQEKEGEINRTSSRLDSIRSIAERYEGYGNAIRRVMEQKDRESGLVGVVADLIHVKQQYETAIETALGGRYTRQ